MLICGSDGFIGKNAFNYFVDQYKMTVFKFDGPKCEYTRNGVRYIHGDLRLEDHVQYLFGRGPYDIVLQAAATTTGSKDVVEQPYVHVTDNAVMNSWIFREAMLSKCGHVIFPSCTVMYQSKNYQQCEDDWDPGQELYDKYFGVGNMKVFMERMCDFYSRIGSTKFTAIRHSNVYGPHDKFDLDKCHVVPALINKIANATNTLDIWGSGKAYRDIIHIDDLIRFIDLCIQGQYESYELFNCGSGQSYSILELAHIIMGFEAKELDINFQTDKPDIPTTIILNCDKAKFKLGWTPQVPVINGLKKTYDWYKQVYDI